MIILYLSVCYPFAIRYLSFCDLILYISILGFQLKFFSHCVQLAIGGRDHVTQQMNIFVRASVTIVAWYRVPKYQALSVYMS